MNRLWSTQTVESSSAQKADGLPMDVSNRPECREPTSRTPCPGKGKAVGTSPGWLQGWDGRMRAGHSGGWNCPASWSGGYMILCICQNLENCTPSRVNFSIFK